MSRRIDGWTTMGAVAAATLLLLFAREYPERSRGAVPPEHQTGTDPVETVAPLALSFESSFSNRTRGDIAVRDDIRAEKGLGENALGAFAEWARDHLAKTNHPNSRHDVEAGLALARVRASAMAGLIRTDPKAALAMAIPMGTRQRLPAGIQELLEETIAGTGDYLVVSALVVAKDGAEEPITRFVRLANRQYSAFVYGRRRHQPTKHGVFLHGIALAGAVALHESPARLLEHPNATDNSTSHRECPLCLNPAPASTMAGSGRNEGSKGIFVAEVPGRVYRLCSAEHVEQFESRLCEAEERAGPAVHYPDSDTDWRSRDIFTSASANAWSLGPKAVLLIRADFSDLPGEPVGYGEGGTLTNLSLTAGLDLIANQANRFFQESSYNKTVLSGSVTPVLRLPQTAAYYATNNNYYLLHTDAQAAAAAAGFTVGSFDRIAVAFSSPSNLPNNRFFFAGRGEVGGKNLWLHRNFSVAVTAHELGHTYGLWHANSWEPYDNSVIGPGISVEYGDLFDTMGNGHDYLYDFNPWFKTMLRWIEPAEIINVQSNGIYRVHRFDHPAAGGTLALKIRQDSERTYWIGLRQQPTNHPSLVNGAYMVWGYNYNRASDLLDTARRDPGVGLEVGRTLLDSAHGILVAPQAKGGVTPHEFLDLYIRVDAFPPAITAQPTNLTVFEGTDARFSVEAQSSAPTTFQWLFEGNPLAGETGNALVLPAVLPDSAGRYAVMVSNAFGVVTSAVSTLTVTTPFGLALETLDLRWRSGGDALWVLQSATTHDGVDATQSGLTSDGQESWMEVSLAGPGLLSFWWKVSSQRNADMLQFLGGGQQISISGEVDWRQIVLSIAPGQQVLRWRYLKDSAGSRGADVGWVDEVTYIPPPFITAHPQSQSVSESATVTFEVAASSPAALRYQWQLNGSSLPSQTNASLTLTAAQTTNAGNYTVIVSNVAGSRTSDQARLIVHSPPPFAWARQAGSFNYDAASKVTVDHSGNIIVVGLFAATAEFAPTNLTSLGQSDVFLAKYTPAGNLLWVRQIGTTNSEYEPSVATDQKGNIYLGGQFHGTLQLGTTLLNWGRDQLYLVKYDAQGTLLWSRQTATETGYNFCSDLVVDRDDNVVFCGHVYPQAFGSIPETGGGFIAKMDPNGTLLWMRTAEDDSVVEVGTDRGGNYFSFGYTRSETNANHDLFVSKYDNDGNQAWVRRIPCAGPGYAVSMAVDTSGNVFVLGKFYDEIQVGGRALSSRGSSDIFWAKYTSNGDLCWTSSAGGFSLDAASGCAVDDAGNFYFTGMVNGAPTLANTPLGTTGWGTFLSKMDQDGRLVWVRRLNLGGVAHAFPATDGAANVYLAGWFWNSVTLGTNSLTTTTTNQADIFVAKLNTISPPLDIAKTNGQIVLSWPSLAEGFAAEWTTNVQNPSGWGIIPLAPSATGDHYRVITPSTGDKMFFRLRK